MNFDLREELLFLLLGLERHLGHNFGREANAVRVNDFVAFCKTTLCITAYVGNVLRPEVCPW